MVHIHSLSLFYNGASLVLYGPSLLSIFATCSRMRAIKIGRNTYTPDPILYETDYMHEARYS